MTTSPSPTGPGQLIKSDEMRKYMADYQKRQVAIEYAFEKLPVSHRPYDVSQETIAWIFNREVLEEFLHKTAKDSQYIALAFGVGPKDHDEKGCPVPGSPDVLHILMTMAEKEGNDGESGSFTLPAMVKNRFAEDDDVAAEHGTACCFLSHFECMEKLFDTGKVTTPKD